MTEQLAHVVLSGALIALGLYLFDHPRVLSSRTRLFRGTVIWIVLVLSLRAFDYVFLP